jgi:hypothetical protein
MDIVARQLIRAVRGRRSQVALSRRLGYRGNPIADWEAGRRFPTAEEALRVCERSGVDVVAALTRFHAPVVGAYLDGGLPAWLRALRGQTPLSLIATRSDRSRYAVARWLAGDARPRLPDWLRLVDVLTGRMSDLVAALVPIASVPGLADDHARRQASRLLAVDEPWTEAVLRVLETRACSPGEVAAVLGIAEEVVRRSLDLLASSGVLVDGRIVGSLTVDTAALPALRRHWAEVALGRIDRAGARGLYSYNVVSVSRADLDRIEALHRAYFREVRTIVAASEPAEAVALINVQLVRFSES